MGKKGPTKHLKRHQSPPHWPIHRKGGVWTKRTKPGPHNMQTSIPTTIILRDRLNYAKSANEAKKIRHDKKYIFLILKKLQFYLNSIRFQQYMLFTNIGHPVYSYIVALTNKLVVDYGYGPILSGNCSP